MVELENIKAIVAETLQIQSQLDGLTADSGLLGCIPEFDSMAVVMVITAIEEYFDILIDDDEITGEIFETLGTLHDFVSQKVVA